MKSPLVIPLVVFLITFIVTLVLTILSAYVWDREKKVSPSAGIKAMPPFPLVAPLVAPPPVDPSDTVCVNLVGDASGGYVPSPLAPLRACTHDSECDDCHVTPEEMDERVRRTIKCVEASTYPGTAEAQSELGNPGSKFCLPEKRACLPPTSDALVACTHDSECAQCSDEIGDGSGMVCQIVSQRKLLSRRGTLSEVAALGPDDVVVVEPGKWCLPRTGTCDAENGVLQWTTEGWSCMCRYPSVHTGEACNVMKACNNFLTTPWSASHQQLLINEANANEPEVWEMASGVNPTACHTPGNIDRSQWDKVCEPDNPNLVSNTVCQCDGLMRGSHMGFRSEGENPLTCSPDSCNVSAQGGRAHEPLALVDWSTDPAVPPNQCICSGANSRIWDSERDGGREQEGYVWRGRCNDVTLPHSEVVIRADAERMASAMCSTPSNSAADVTSLVPGYAQDATGSATVGVCSADPCRGQYSDPNIAPPEGLKNWGHYDATVGACACAAPSASVAVDECDNVLNPACSTCVNACVGMDSDDPNDWPCQRHPLRPCPAKPTCLTDEQGKAQCVCDSKCTSTDSMTCAEKFESEAGCHGFVGVPNICTTGTCKCHKGEGTAGGLFALRCEDKGTFYAKCTTDSSATPTCREGSGGLFRKCSSVNCPTQRGCERIDV